MSAPGEQVVDLHRRTSAQAVVEATITRRKTAHATALASDERMLKALSDAFEAAQQPLSAEEQSGLTSVAATIIGGSYVTIGGLALGGGNMMGPNPHPSRSRSRSRSRSPSPSPSPNPNQGILMGMRSFEETAAFEVSLA